MSRPLGTQYMLAEGAGSEFELTKRPNFRIIIPGMDITLLALSCDLPDVLVDVQFAYHGNERVGAPGKAQTGKLNITFYDAISPDILLQLDDWFAQVYDATTGRIGYASDCKRTIIIVQMDHKGNDLRQFRCKGVFPTHAPKPGQGFDASSGDFVTLPMSFHCDRCSPREFDGTGGALV